jgi:hypothetical protein
MRNGTSVFIASTLLCGFALVSLGAQSFPVPPVKPGLWETTSAVLDADGHETMPPEQAALARLSPEVRAGMAESMKARGITMPDANGATRACLTHELFSSGRWQQIATEAGCTTTFSARTGKTWKWHSSCTAMKAESDGEMVFTSDESYRATLTTTLTMAGKTRTTNRIVRAKWLGTSCGDLKPLTP